MAIQVRIRKLERELAELKRKLSKGGSITVPVLTFAPEPFEVIKPILIMVRATGEEYLASFVDANINASGRTETEAIANLKDIVLTVFEHLCQQPSSKLGPGPKRRLAVLKEFIRKRPGKHGQNNYQGIGRKNR